MENGASSRAASTLGVYALRDLGHSLQSLDMGLEGRPHPRATEAVVAEEGRPLRSPLPLAQHS